MDASELGGHIGTAVGAVLATLAVGFPLIRSAQRDAKAALELAQRLEERHNDHGRRLDDHKERISGEHSQRHALQTQFVTYLQEQGRQWIEAAKLWGQIDERTKTTKRP